MESIPSESDKDSAFTRKCTLLEKLDAHVETAAIVRGDDCCVWEKGFHGALPPFNKGLAALSPDVAGANYSAISSLILVKFWVRAARHLRYLIG